MFFFLAGVGWQSSLETCLSRDKFSIPTHILFAYCTKRHKIQRNVIAVICSPFSSHICCQPNHGAVQAASPSLGLVDVPPCEAALPPRGIPHPGALPHPVRQQGSEKFGRWGRIYPDKAKSHGHFGPKTTYKIFRQTDRHTQRQTDRQTDKPTDRKVGIIFPENFIQT